MTGNRGTPRRPAAKKTRAKKATPNKPPPKKKPAKPRTPTGPVLAAVKRDLAAIAKTDKELAAGALAASAQQLAREMDNKENSATSKAACARALVDTMAQLRALAPKRANKDVVDDLSDRRRARRLAGRAET